MTAIRAARPRTPPDRVARIALSGVLALLLAACAAVLAWSVIASRPTSGGDVLRLAGDLIPLAAAFVTAAFLVWAPKVTWFSVYLAVSLVLYVIGATRIDDLAAGLLPAAPWFGPVFLTVSCFGFLPAAYLFPNGRFVPGWSRWLLVGWVAAAMLALAFPWGDYPPVALAVLTLLAGGLVVSLIVAQVYRYLRVSTQAERQQTKWLLLALGAQTVWLMVVIALPPGTIGHLPGTEGAVLDGLLVAAAALVTTALAVAIGFAMLRYRLFEVDLVVGRALVYGAIMGFTVLCYVVLVGAVGFLWPAGTPLALPVTATLVAALSAATVHRVVQRRVNRWLYGQRDEPARVLGRLGDELSTASDLDGTLARIATTVQTALRFPRVTAVAVSDESLIGEATAGDATGGRDTATVHIAFEDQHVGRLEVAPRAGERLTPRDRRLLEELARPAGVAIHAALITEELRRSQASLIEAREQERRRLHRDLHDGLGPTLSSLHQRIDLAASVMDADPDRARYLLAGAKAGLSGALGELRTLVDSLRPAALDRLGLVGAISHAWASDERVVVEAAPGLPAIPAAIESAAYRIGMEAISNAVRHSGAARCSVTITGSGGLLVIHVADDGRGMTAATAGGGMRTMRERATEAGGVFEVADAAPGTLITARLPLNGRVA